MKKTLMFLGVVMAALFLSVNCFAQEQTDEENTDAVVGEIDYENTPINKLGRGAINTATFWTEIPAKVAEKSAETDPLLGLTLGTVEGAVTAVVRGATGLFDMFTCFMPPYDKPVMKPEYAYKNADDQIKEYLW